MLFHVKMVVKLPPDMPVERANELKATEKAMAQRLQKEGIWRHLWRIAACVVGAHDWSDWEIRDPDRPSEPVRTCARCGRMKSNAAPVSFKACT